MRIGRMTIIAILAAYSILFAHSCATMDQVAPTVIEATYDEAGALITAANQEIARLEAKTDLTPDEAGLLAKNKAWVANIESLVAQSRAGADAAGRPVDVGDVITGLTPFLGPYGIPLSIAVGAASEWWRGRKKRKSFDTLRGLIGAINEVKKNDGEFATALDNAGGALRAEMGSAVRDEVDTVRKADRG